ncbi:hypothetical protein AB1E18_012608 [Capra hircus]
MSGVIHPQLPEHSRVPADFSFSVGEMSEEEIEKKTLASAVACLEGKRLDVEDVKFVINFNYPNSSEDYLHRIGRTLTVPKQFLKDELKATMEESLQKHPSLHREVKIKVKKV